MPPITKVEDQPNLVPTKEFPYAKWKFEQFNPVQSRIMDFYDKETSGLIASSTSSGKTVIAEQFISHEIRKRGGKALYLVPMRALAQEKIDEWTDKEYHFADKKISICTGDYRLTKERAKELDDADIIIMTSEMLSHRSRNYKSEQNNWLKAVGTIIVDECLSPDSLIETNQGYIPIGRIIDENLDVLVASLNHKTNKVEYKKIKNRQKKLLKRKWLTLYYEGGNISTTENHMIWCEGRGYIPSKNLIIGDIIYVRRVNKQRETDFIGYDVRGRLNFQKSTREIGKTSGAAKCESKEFCKLEIQRIEKIGWNPAENCETMQIEMGQDVRENEDMGREVGIESWCCDLEIEADCFEDCNFFADGVLVHNSHLLTVSGRGDHLEVGLMKFSDINPNARLVLLSATMPNVEEIAEWVSYSLTKKDTFVLKSKFRPVPLNVHYESYSDDSKYYDNVEKEKVNKAMDIIEWYKDDKFLVFAHTKRTGEMMQLALKQAGISVEFHNANLEKNARIGLENKFRNEKSPQVLVATSTLAWGCYSHGSIVYGKNGMPLKVESLRVGDDLLCPVGESYQNKKLVRFKDFEQENGYYVKLETGEEMKVSKDHIFMAANKRNSPDWIKVSDIEKGDFLAIPSNLGLYKKPTKFNDFWYLAGVCFGDGSIVKAGKHVDGKDKWMLDFCMGKRDSFAFNTLNKFNDLFKTDHHLRDDMNGVPHFQCKKRKIVHRFVSILPLGKKNGKHDVPVNLFGHATRSASFLSGWFDADGGVEDHSNGNKSVGLSCISKNAIISARSLLLCFGIRSSFGKKRMKDRVINGRFQKAKRKWSYRLRIFGIDNLIRFVKLVGFQHPDKIAALNSYLENNSEKLSKDLVPARSLLKEHLIANNLKNKDFEEITGSELWNSLNVQDCNRKTVQKLLQATEQRTGLNELMEKPIYWSRIKEIKLIKGGMFREIEVEDPHAYIGEGVISHNCNLPARRVIILGPYRGLSEVECHDILQMIGRSGRLGIDPIGDAYILVPESKEQHFRDKYSKPNRIESQLLGSIGTNHKILAFHLVSEIHHGNVETTDDVHRWYKKSLAYFQNKELDDSVVDHTLELLRKCGAIAQEDDKWFARPIGKIASMFYFSPFDVSDLYFNFKDLFEQNKEDDDYCLSMAIGNTDSQRLNIVSRIEKEEMGMYHTQVKNKVSKFFNEASCKAGFCYFNLLNGVHGQATSAMQRNLQFDYNRVSQVLQALDSMAAKWDKNLWFQVLESRITNGVPAYLVDLCRVANVGKVRAKRLFDAGIKSVEDLADTEPNKIKGLLKMKDDVINQIINDAKTISLTNS